MKLRQNLPLSLLAAVALTAPSLAADDCCTTSAAAPAGDTQATSTDVAAPSKLELDRQAILAMAGEYKVNFRFAETVPLVAGYEFRNPKDSGATEFVEVIADEPGLIDLQHVLVMGDGPDARVVKHWRQTWTYEDDAITEYAGHDTWAKRELNEGERAGTWSQFVTQVDDSPRYESFGAWTHADGVSAWQGNATWRPLPRREYTTRDDYDVMGCVNRHTITPTGWVHEQDNTKIVLTDSGEVETVLVREVGLNTYDRMGEGIAAGETHDFSAGRAYWQKTAPFWADVREAWDRRLDEGTVSLKAIVDDQRLHEAMFGYADAVAEAGSYDEAEGEAFIDKTLAAFSADRAAGTASAQ